MKIQVLGALAIIFSVHYAKAQEVVSYDRDPLPACATGVATGGGKSFALGCDLAAGGETNPVVLVPDRSIWQRTSSGWQRFTDFAGAQIAVSGQGTPWVLNANSGGIFEWKGGTWVQLPGCAISIGVGQTETDAWIVGCGNGPDNQIWRFNGTSWSTPQSNARARYVAVGSDNVPWVVTSNGSIFRWNGSTFGSPLPGCASAIGGNGWIVGCDRKSVWQFGNGNWFNWWNDSQVIYAISNDGLLLNEQFYPGSGGGHVLLQNIQVVK